MIMNELDKPLTYDEFRQLAIDAKRAGRSVFQEYQTRSTFNGSSSLGRALAGGYAGNTDTSEDERILADSVSSGISKKWAKRRMQQALHKLQKRNAVNT